MRSLAPEFSPYLCEIDPSMKIDLSKISQEELDSIIKEETLKIRAEMLANQKKKAKIAHLNEMKKSLEAELDSLDLDEGILGKLFGGNKGGNDPARRQQMIVNLLNHPNKGMALLQYASPEQVQEFKSYLGNKAGLVDAIIAKRLGGKTMNDPKRAEKYINFFLQGGSMPKWDAATSDYLDAARVGTGAAHNFQREQEGQS